MSSLGGTSPGVSPRPLPSGSDALFVALLHWGRGFTNPSVVCLYFFCCTEYFSVNIHRIWACWPLFFTFFLYMLFMPYYYIFSFTFTEYVRHPQTSYMQEVRWGGRCGRGNQLATRDRWCIQFPWLTPCECVSLQLTLPHALGDAQSTFFLLWAWHLPEKLRAQNKSAPCGGSGHLGASSLRQPLGRGLEAGSWELTSNLDSAWE